MDCPGLGGNPPGSEKPPGVLPHRLQERLTHRIQKQHLLRFWTHKKHQPSLTDAIILTFHNFQFLQQTNHTVFNSSCSLSKNKETWQPSAIACDTCMVNGRINRPFTFSYFPIVIILTRLFSIVFELEEKCSKCSHGIQETLNLFAGRFPCGTIIK